MGLETNEATTPVLPRKEEEAFMRRWRFAFDRQILHYIGSNVWFATFRSISFQTTQKCAKCIPIHINNVVALAAQNKSQVRDFAMP